ncbi:hypothetical protein ACLBXM_22610 [Xanthobacteraceae bacterium A53D]
MAILLEIRRSLIAGLAVFALALLSMGALGVGLYYAVSPLLAERFGPLAEWSGDWVWPATIMAGILWSLSFPIAGLLGVRLRRAGRSVLLRRSAYVVVLYLGAALACLASFAALRG